MGDIWHFRKEESSLQTQRMRALTRSRWHPGKSWFQTRTNHIVIGIEYCSDLFLEWPALCPKFKPTMSTTTSQFEPTLVLILYRYLLWFQLCRWFYKELLFCSQFELLSVMKHLPYFNVVPTMWNTLRRSSFTWSSNYMLLFTLIFIVVWFLPYARFEIKLEKLRVNTCYAWRDSHQAPVIS